MSNKKRLEYNQTVPYLNSKDDDDDRSTGVSAYPSLTTKMFKKLLERNIEIYCKDTKNKDGMGTKPGNILIFGAPGIGKSTIPREVVMEYNKNKEGKDRIALISVNCANIQGDLVMPVSVKKKDVLSFIKKNIGSLFKRDSFKKTDLDKTLGDINDDQYVAVNAPQPWLPCYEPTGDPFKDAYLDELANGGIMDVSGSNSEKTGSGGIILLDNFFRAEPMISRKLTSFQFNREYKGWRLGSKWFIIACTNRPCDDNCTSDNWRKFGVVDRDRWAEWYHMEPDPKSWKDWAETKGFDKTLMEFIFDKSPESFISGEYTRWYRVANKDFKTSYKSVTPRNWMRINKKLIKYKKHNIAKFNNIEDGDFGSHMTIDEVDEVVRGIFDNSFTNELLGWLKNYYKNNNFPNVRDIANNPTGTQLMIHTNQSH